MAMGSVGNTKKCHTRGFTEDRSTSIEVCEDPVLGALIHRGGSGKPAFPPSGFALSITSCPLPQQTSSGFLLCFSFSSAFAGRPLRYCAHIHLQCKMSKEEMMFDINPTLKNSLSSRPLWRSRREEKGLRYFLFSLSLV